MSRFVSAGTAEDEAAAPGSERDEAWEKAQQQIEAARSATGAQKPRPGEQEGGKSLYETLQANKAAKQEAFEEQNRLRNQFRSLDDDEVEFLDSVMESTRAKEAEVRRETRDQLDEFRRRQQGEGDSVAAGGGKGGDAGAEGVKEEVKESWAAGPRKRKKGREGLVGGVKVRRTSTAEKGAAATSGEKKRDAGDASPAAGTSPSAGSTTATTTKPDKSTKPADAASTETKGTKPPSPPTQSSAGLGLAAYSSDEDESDSI